MNQPRLTCPNISLRDATPIVHALASQVPPQNLPMFILTSDHIVWRWDTKGVCSAKSVYDVMSAEGKIKWRFQEAWINKAPQTVRSFTFLLLKERILTHDVMKKKGMQCDTRCHLCDTSRMETALHLLFGCPYAIMVWRVNATHLGYPIFTRGLSVQQVWCASWSGTRHRQDMERGT